MPSLTALRTPTPAAAEASGRSAAVCTDEVLGSVVRAPDVVAVGSTPTVELVVTNTSPPLAGDYLLRGRLDTKVSRSTPMTLRQL